MIRAYAISWVSAVWALLIIAGVDRSIIAVPGLVSVAVAFYVYARDIRRTFARYDEHYHPSRRRTDKDA